MEDLAGQGPVADVSGFERIKQLAKVTGSRRIEHLLALGRTADPFFAGAPAQQRDAEWFAMWWHRLGLQSRKNIHVRGVHYLLVSQPKGTVIRPDGTAYENTDPIWAWLAGISAPARYLRLVDADAFIDRKNHGLELHAAHAARLAGRPTDGSWTVDEPGAWWSLPEIETDPGWDLAFRLPRPEVTGYDYDLADQPYLLEVWVEKSTMNDVLQPVCDALGVNLVYSTGFQSITNARNLLKRVEATGRTARVFYISDFDPAGDLMPVAVARQLEYWLPQLTPGADVKLTPVVLTQAQVQAYRLPRTPIKKEDLRKGAFEDAYGKDAAELDALEALHPGELARLVREALLPYLDMTLRQRLSRAEAEARRVVDAAWDAATAPYRDELDEIAEQAASITAAYQTRLEHLNDALQEELAPLNDRLQTVRRATQDAVYDLQVELPERPPPEPDPIDEDEWLFDAERDYLTQLVVYKRRRGEEVAEVVIHTDGLTNSQRQTIGLIRDAGDAGITVKALMAPLGITAWPAGRRRVQELLELGLVEGTGRGTKNDPTVWRLIPTETTLVG